MLHLVVTIVLILIVSSGFGKISDRIFGKYWNGISGECFSGMLLLTVLWCIVAFFIPLNSTVEIVFLIAGIISWIYFKSYRDFLLFFKNVSPYFYVISVFVLFFTSFFPFILDHFGYYVPTIKWLSEIGLSKGLVNLDIILAQTSFWHILQTGFSHFSDPFLRLNGVVLILYLVYCFEKKEWTLLLFLPVFLFFVQSPSPDLPVMCFSLIILNEILKSKTLNLTLLPASVFIFCIKPTMIWLPLFYGILLIWNRKFKLKPWLISFFILLIFVVKNYYTFGYPVVPITFGSIGLPWEPSSEILKNSSEMAIQKTYDMQYSIDEIRHFSALDYMKNWLFLSGIKSIINTSFIIALIAFTAFALKKRKKIWTILWFSILLKSSLVLLFSAQYRFFIDVFLVIAFIVLFGKNIEKWIFKILIFSGIVLGILFSFPKILQQILPGLRISGFMSGFDWKQLYQPSEYEPVESTSSKIGKFKFYLPKDYPFSYSTPIPAISPSFLQENLDAGIIPQPYSETLKDGFYWKKATPEELQKMKNILDEWQLSFEHEFESKSHKNP